MESLLKFFLNHAAAVSAFIAVLSLILTCTTLYIQRRHYRRSVRPIASIPIADFENNIGVMLKNKGIGPLHVVQFRVTDGEATKHNIISWMPELPQQVRYYEDLDDMWVQPGEAVKILELTGEPVDPNFTVARNLCREALSRLTVSVTGKDIYDKHVPAAKKNLAFFGRAHCLEKKTFSVHKVS